MKLIILMLGFACAPVFADPCSGSVHLGSLELNGQCMNSACQVQWGGFISSSLNCGALRATITGSINGASQASCNGGFANIQIGGAFVELQGSCSNGHRFSGQAMLGATVAAASCQPNGSVFGSVNGGPVEVTGNCL